MKTTRENELERRIENLKEQLVEIVLYLQSPLTEDEQKRCWRIFELKLRRYVDLRFCR